MPWAPTSCPGPGGLKQGSLSSLSCPAPSPATAMVPQSDTVKAETRASVLQVDTHRGVYVGSTGDEHLLCVRLVNA